MLPFGCMSTPVSTVGPGATMPTDSNRPRPYRFAIQGGPFGDADALTRHARLVESLGYEEFYTSDHIGVQQGEGGTGAVYTVDPLLPLMVAAGATTRLRVGPLVLNNEFYNPALLARAAATADRLTGGRLILGLGTGYSAVEHDAIGSPIRPPRQRVTRFEESLAVLRSLLTDGAAEHDGAHESIHIADIGIAPIQERLPFLVGGHGRRVVGIAGRHADIFQFTGLTHARDGTPQAGGFAVEDLLRRSEWLAESAGERHPSIERSALVQFAACGGDAPSSATLADRFDLDIDTIEESPFVLSGSVEQLADKLGRLRSRLGISHYVVRDAEGFAPAVDALAGG